MDCCAKPTRLPAGPFCFPQQSVLLGQWQGRAASQITTAPLSVDVTSGFHCAYVRAQSVFAPGLVLRPNGCTLFSPRNDLLLLLLVTTTTFLFGASCCAPTVDLVRRTQRYDTTAAAASKPHGVRVSVQRVVALLLQHIMYTDLSTCEPLFSTADCLRSRI